MLHASGQLENTSMKPVMSWRLLWRISQLLKKKKVRQLASVMMTSSSTNSICLSVKKSEDIFIGMEKVSSRASGSKTIITLNGMNLPVFSAGYAGYLLYHRRNLADPYFTYRCGCDAHDFSANHWRWSLQGGFFRRELMMRPTANNLHQIEGLVVGKAFLPTIISSRNASIDRAKMFGAERAKPFASFYCFLIHWAICWGRCSASSCGAGCM